jgi:hypothetical protein
MGKVTSLMISVCFLLSCKQKSVVDTSFYFWRTQYKQHKSEIRYLEQFKSKSIYVRIMDVDFNPDLQQAAPVSPITFSDPLPEAIDIIPVVFIVNQVFTRLDSAQRAVLAGRIATFVTAKVKQAGKRGFTALQIDCDWTKTTRDSYFDFLEKLEAHPLLRGKMLSVTLRLHQVKNIASSGIPPVERAMLMCYNMGNLRKYGPQNSILDQEEMNVYLKDYLENYPLKLDVALPVFEWAVVFRNAAYAGISRHISKAQLQDKKLFKQKDNSILYELQVDYPAAGLKRGDIIRWEDISAEELLETSGFLARHLKPADRNIVFYHLDTNLLKQFTDEDLQKVIAKF